MVQQLLVGWTEGIMIVQAVWLPPHGGEIEPTVPLVWHGERMRRLGWANQIHLLFLNGLDRVEAGYRTRLEELGYRLHDVGEDCAKATAALPRLAELPPTNRFWFTRWAMIELLVQRGELTLPLIHLDGDVVLMAPPEEIEADVRGKTFVLQGCPAFTSISDPQWFEDWTAGLRFWNDQPADCDMLAREMMRNPNRDDRQYCNERAYDFDRKWHDQDLMQLLISAGRLRQDPSEKIFHSHYYWMHNPADPHLWADEQGIGEDEHITSNGHDALIAGRPVPFYHFQGDFLRICRWYLNLRLVGCQRATAVLHPRHPQYRTSQLNKALLVTEKALRMSRLAVYNRVYSGGPDDTETVNQIANFCWQLAVTDPAVLLPSNAAHNPGDR